MNNIKSLIDSTGKTVNYYTETTEVSIESTEEIVDLTMTAARKGFFEYRVIGENGFFEIAFLDSEINDEDAEKIEWQLKEEDEE
jgi:hypothetical protein